MRSGRRRRGPEDCGTVAKLFRRQLAERAVRPELVVVDPPLLDRGARLVEGQKPVLVETSSRNLPLKLSTKAFWTGLPGWMKRSSTPLR